MAVLRKANFSGYDLSQKNRLLALQQTVFPFLASGQRQGFCTPATPQGEQGDLRMANFHLCTKIIKRSTGRTAVAAAAYRAGEKIKNEQTGKIHNFVRKEGVIYSELLFPENAPAWNRSQLWNAAEAAEKRSDAQVAREVEISLPRELSQDQQIRLAKDFAIENFVKKGMCADLCFHDKNDGNPHCHIMLTMREIDENGFSKKKNRDWNKKELVELWRADYCRRENAAYAAAGYDITVDHKSYKRQGVFDDFVPQIHQGHQVTSMERKAKRRAKKQGKEYIPVTNIGQSNAAIKLHNENMIVIYEKLSELDEQLEQKIQLQKEEKKLYSVPVSDEIKAKIKNIDLNERDFEKYDINTLQKRINQVEEISDQLHKEIRSNVERKIRKENPLQLPDIKPLEKIYQSAKTELEQSQNWLKNVVAEEKEIQSSFFKRIIYEVKPEIKKAAENDVLLKKKAANEAAYVLLKAQKKNDNIEIQHEKKITNIINDTISKIPIKKIFDDWTKAARSQLATLYAELNKKDSIEENYKRSKIKTKAEIQAEIEAEECFER